MGEKEIKAILEPEFSINDEITIAHGGKSTRKNSKLSFRYFLIFNTLSKDIIDNGKVFFDKEDLKTIDDQLSRTANVPYRSIPAAEKLVSLGEIRSDYKHIDPMPQDTDLDDQINNKKPLFQEKILFAYSKEYFCYSSFGKGVLAFVFQYFMLSWYCILFYWPRIIAIKREIYRFFRYSAFQK